MGKFVFAITRQTSTGGWPVRIDSLSAAFRNLTLDQREDTTRRYNAFVGHYGMEASRNNRGEAHENGWMEAHNGYIRTAIEQALILRGSSDFSSIEDYRALPTFWWPGATGSGQLPFKRNGRI